MKSSKTRQEDNPVPNNKDVSRKILSDLTVFTKYAKYHSNTKRREVFSEIVDRNKEMHMNKFPELGDEIRKAYQFVEDKKVLPSMRSMQFAGKPINLNNSRIYNCSFLHVKSPYNFAEVMFLLLSGCGVGYSVQYRHVKQLPVITKPKKTRKFVIGDSIEGWSDAVKALVKAYFFGKTLPIFDYSDIRPKGARLVTAGGKAPGSEPLRNCLTQLKRIFDEKDDGEQLKSIEIHDIVCHIADAVLAGGIRRAALICLFDKEDNDMLNCKSNCAAEFVDAEKQGDHYRVIVKYTDPHYEFNSKTFEIFLSEKELEEFQETGLLPWYFFNPQRGRANNSIVLFRNNWYGKDITDNKSKVKKMTKRNGRKKTVFQFLSDNEEEVANYYIEDDRVYDDFIPETTAKEFEEIWAKVEANKSGEPGFFWTNHPSLGTNPCAEISLKDRQFCNLTELNVSTLKNQKDLLDRVEAAAILGTLQATYTDFHYLTNQWKENCNKDALLGIGLTGIADLGDKYKEFDWVEAAEHAKKVNEQWAKKLGINAAARVTTIKPSGSTSCVLGTSSGVHGRFSEYYIRRMRFNKNESIAQYLSANHPEIVEDEHGNALGLVVSIPQASPTQAILGSEPSPDTLERVKYFNQTWVSNGHRKGVNKHNVSCTIYVKQHEWSEIGKWLWDNRDHYNGISVLPYDGGTYKQSPFETISEDKFEEMFTKLKEVDLRNVVEDDDKTTLNQQVACAGGACEI